jgi:RNA polymerase sigma factor (sigma-70 family)
MPDSSPAGSREDDLLRRLLAGDATAWAEMVGTYSALLAAVARRTFATYGYVPVALDADDVVAEVWRNVLAGDRRVLRRCLEHGHLLATLHTLVRNRAVDVMRRHRLKTLDIDAHRIPEPVRDDDDDDDDRLPPERVREAFAVLNDRERTIVELFHLQGRKYVEIAALTGIPQNSIGPTMGRALAKLRSALERP